MDTVEKKKEEEEAGQSECSFPLWPMTGATLLSNLSNENVGATIERGERDLYPLTTLKEVSVSGCAE